MNTLNAILISSLFYSCTLFSQDTVYARKCIKYLSSEKCFGRGYVKKGLAKACSFITSEIRQENVEPLFGQSFLQPFSHTVNTFPGACDVHINGQKLVPGKEFILDARSGGLKGKFDLTKSDSAHYTYSYNNKKVSVTLKQKLTFTVGHEAAEFTGIEVDKTRFIEEPKTIRVNIKNKLKTFQSNNIGCYFDGTVSDSLLIYSAHYDHLGGMGRSTFFPGANDNASGVSMLLDLIKYYKKNPPRFKTVFIFFAAEEAGLLGSRHFVDHPAIELKKIKFMINLDLLGTGDDGIMVVNGAIHEKEFNQIKSINDSLNLVKEIRKRGKAANSDHYWFSEAGVPCFFIYTMGGIKAYHDVFDIEKTLPLTDYTDVFRLITLFSNN